MPVVLSIGSFVKRPQLSILFKCQTSCESTALPILTVISQSTPWHLCWHACSTVQKRQPKFSKCDALKTDFSQTAGSRQIQANLINMEAQTRYDIEERSFAFFWCHHPRIRNLSKIKSLFAHCPTIIHHPPISQFRSKEKAADHDWRNHRHLSKNKFVSVKTTLSPSITDPQSRFALIT